MAVVDADSNRTDAGGRFQFSLLPELPDTAEEIRSVGESLGAVVDRDIFLRQRATEHVVKTQDLSAYRVIMFATHGLVPGDMPGLFQPALALSNPDLTGDGDDGMLTMEEILGLNLHAEWVVLSACNTASPSGDGSEAVSGLGRAFFHAGAQALLVTDWPVETVSARLLTTATFRLQADTPGLSRARALQSAELGLMHQSAGNSFTFGHPLFWAPFVLVGDGS